MSRKRMQRTVATFTPVSDLHSSRSGSFLLGGSVIGKLCFKRTGSSCDASAIGQLAELLAKAGVFVEARYVYEIAFSLERDPAVRNFLRRTGRLKPRTRAMNERTSGARFRLLLPVGGRAA